MPWWQSAKSNRTGDAPARRCHHHLVHMGRSPRFQNLHKATPVMSDIPTMGETNTAINSPPAASAYQADEGLGRPHDVTS